MTRFLFVFVAGLVLAACTAAEEKDKDLDTASTFFGYGGLGGGGYGGGFGGGYGKIEQSEGALQQQHIVYL